MNCERDLINMLRGSTVCERVARPPTAPINVHNVQSLLEFHFLYEFRTEINFCCYQNHVDITLDSKSHHIRFINKYLVSGEEQISLIKYLLGFTVILTMTFLFISRIKYLIIFMLRMTVVYRLSWLHQLKWYLRGPQQWLKGSS